eukprot:SAG31_NODE_1041_length_10203_cov_1.922902_2_plen_316_part_00
MGGGASRRRKASEESVPDMVFTRTTELTPDAIVQLKRSQLKRHLKAVGMSTIGDRKELAVRLAGDIRHVAAECAGDGSDYWKSVHKLSELHIHRVETVNPEQGRKIGQLRTVQNSLAEARQLCYAAKLSAEEEKAEAKIARVRELIQNQASRAGQSDLECSDDLAQTSEPAASTLATLLPGAPSLGSDTSTQSGTLSEKEASAYTPQEYRVLASTPVRELAQHDAAHVHTLDAGRLVEAQDHVTTSLGAEWIKIAGWKSAGLDRWSGWAALLADNGWQVQLGKHEFSKQRKQQKAWKKASKSLMSSAKLSESLLL